MNDSKQLKCQKCGRPVTYAAVSVKSFLVPTPALDNVKLVAHAPSAQAKQAGTAETFNTPFVSYNCE